MPKFTWNFPCMVPQSTTKKFKLFVRLLSRQIINVIFKTIRSFTVNAYTTSKPFSISFFSYCYTNPDAHVIIYDNKMIFSEKTCQKYKADSEGANKLNNASHR